ncbi:MAG: PD40 domain-containing protein [Phototrophicales bacterium]
MKHFSLLFIVLLVCVLSISAQQHAVPGKIVYIGQDNNVYTYDLMAGERHILTDDATPARVYQYPVWSNDGRLAYFCCDATRTSQLQTQVYISSDGIQAGELAHQIPLSIFTYAYWAPRNCDTDASCRDLSILVGGNEGFSLVFVRDLQTQNTSQIIGQGAPFYYSWSPDARQLITQRNQRQLDIYHIDQETFQTIPLQPGFFSAPAWSPVDDRLLMGVLNPIDRTTDLVIYANDSTTMLVEGLAGSVAFSWSPDGNMIAYRTITRNTIGELIVIDAITGEVIARTTSAEVLSFFWSPNSQKIAFVTIAQPRGTFNINNPLQETPLSLLGWSVLDVTNGIARAYSNFTPTDEMIYVLTYFDQFAQSHRIWSPDSTHIVFSEVLPNNQGYGISILDTTRPDTVPFFIAEGVIGFWSFN